MSFNANIPLSTDDPSVSQGQILTNFQQLDTIFGNNHITFTAGSNNGKHNFCQFPEQGAAPATAVNENAVYSADTGTQPDLHYRPENNGTAVRLTGGGITAAAYCTFTGAGALSANSFNITGVVRNGLGSYTITFTRNFANTNFVVSSTVSINDGTAMSSTYSITKNAANINIVTRRTNTGNLVDPGTIEVIIFGILA